MSTDILEWITDNNEDEEIQPLEKPSANALEKHVLDWINKEADGFTNSQKPHRSAVDNLLNCGINSGIVSDLIYYTDTNNFFDTYEEEIVELMEDLIKDLESTEEAILRHGCSIKNIKNSMAWIAFEVTAERLRDELT